MKKNIFTIFFATAFALVAGYNIYASQQKFELSDLALANVEALAQDYESGGVEIICGRNSGPCWMKTGMLCFVGEAHDYACQFVGYTWTSCSSLCN
ncbi:NVEALA domain-containing protein [Bacteroides mediterraneensis]|uniref:NVEALA domain-containing protein n=1 Tax=Bacteroides mediterraneensis TaxID=1841856 RepID=UPI000932F29F|nr:NVEALA domain-containing protein [Bacteroides mediterraneensis]